MSPTLETSQDAATFGWSKSDPRVPFAYKGVSFPGGVNAHPGVATLFTAMLDALVPHIPGGLVSGQCWGGNNDDPVPTSFHLFGLAVDINAPENPQTAHSHTYGAAHELPQNTGAIIAPYGFQWGGSWTPDTPPDYMHCQLMLTPAAVAALAVQIAHGNPPPPANPVDWQPIVNATPGSRTIQLGSRGPDVSALQRCLNAWYPSITPALIIDGDYGPATTARVRYYQTRAGLEIDGITGRHTWSGLGFHVSY